MVNSGPYRAKQRGWVDRARSVPFTFDGRHYAGFAGDSLASALLANGVRIVARSFKFHRPRGVFSCGIEEPCALLQLNEGARAIPSARAPMIELEAGLQASSQVGWPSVRFDFGRILDVLAPLWAAGFYNKTFIWPSWHLYEPIIRHAAGLGRAPESFDPDRYECSNLYCDVLVVGGGVAGILAAIAASDAGHRVVLAEQGHQLGGEALWNGGSVDGTPAQAWLTQSIQILGSRSNVRVLSRTTAAGCYDHNFVTLVERTERSSPTTPRERYWIVRAGRVVLATGAMEQPLIFANNDRPGIMLAGAARQYLRRYGVAVGHRLLIATNNDSAYALAKDLKDAGVNVLGVADTRSNPPDFARELARSLSLELFAGCIPIDTAGSRGLVSVTLAEISPDGRSTRSSRAIPCDALAVSGGFSPTLHLYAQSGGRLVYEEVSGVLVPATRHAGIEIVGSAAEQIPIGPRVAPVGNPRRQWVDLLHDVTVADLQLAVRENFRTVEHAKRYTTVGMAADQGKTSTAAALEVLSRAQGIRPGELGHTTLRPPFTPVTLGTIAGRELGERFAPYRELPMHQWHRVQGALMHDFGEWRRPVAYPRSGEAREHAVKREASTVRTSAGLFDGSSLGKIEIQGPDALEFLDRFYINDLTTLKPHRVRYGLMLRESGVIFDDGTVAMLAPDRLVITTTSGNAERVAQWLEQWHQCEWPKLRVAILLVTDAWATVSLAGPKARAILSRLPGDIELSATAFPHLSLREGNLLGTCARVYRVSFTGELTYEINVPVDAGQALWEALMAAGAPEGIRPFGMDALLLMGVEKGFLHVSVDTDGTTIPDDVGWGRVAANKKRDYIGKRSLSLPAHRRSDRLQLVGLSSETGFSFVSGNHLRLKTSIGGTDGWITSVANTVMSGVPVALAMLRSGRAHVGDEVDMYDDGAIIGKARVVSPPFFDPQGERMNG